MSSSRPSIDRRLAHAHEDRQFENTIEEQRACGEGEDWEIDGRHALSGAMKAPMIERAFASLARRSLDRGGTEQHQDVAAGEDGAAGDATRSDASVVKKKDG